LVRNVHKSPGIDTNYVIVYFAYFKYNEYYYIFKLYKHDKCMIYNLFKQKLCKRLDAASYYAPDFHFIDSVTFSSKKNDLDI